MIWEEFVYSCKLLILPSFFEFNTYYYFTNKQNAIIPSIIAKNNNMPPGVFTIKNTIAAMIANTKNICGWANNKYVNSNAIRFIITPF